MKSSIVSTPILWYLIGFIVLGGLFTGWIVLHIDGTSVFAEDVLKNLFFAIFGSFSVAILIDVGNTARDNKAKKKAFESLKPSLSSLCDILSTAHFLFSEAFKTDKEGCITLRHFYNNEFCFKHKKIVSFKRLEDLSSFQRQCNVIITHIKESSFFENLDNDIKELLEEVQLKGFLLLSDFTKETIQICKIPGFNSEVERLGSVTSKLCAFLGIKNSYSFLTEEEANDYHNQRLQFAMNMPSIASDLLRRALGGSNKK